MANAISCRRDAPDDVRRLSKAHAGGASLPRAISPIRETLEMWKVGMGTLVACRETPRRWRTRKVYAHRLRRLYGTSARWPRNEVTEVLSSDLEQPFDLHRHAVGERADADRHPGVPPGVLEDLHQEVGGAVDHLGLCHEIRHGIDVAGDAHTAHDTVEIPVQLGPQQGHEIEGAQPGRLLPLIDSELTPELADEAALAVPLRELAGQVDQVAGAHRGDVVRPRLAGLRQLDPELFQALRDGAGHGPRR